MSEQQDAISSAPQMSVEGHQRLARTLHLTACLPPLGMVGITMWLLPQLPPLPPERITSLELPFLGVCFLSAILCDTTFYLRLRRFRALPLVSERARIPPLQEARRGWIACGVAWCLAQLYIILGVTEVFLSRKESAMWPFAIFTAITLYRCRPRHGLFAAPHWGSPQPHLVEGEPRDTSSQSSTSHEQEAPNKSQSNKPHKRQRKKKRGGKKR